MDRCISIEEGEEISSPSCTLQQKDEQGTTTLYAGLLTATEVGLGSLLHALHIPFCGQLLSLNQIAILSHASSNISYKTAPMSISAVAALLKSLSPIGKRLTPMLALTMQGLLYTSAVLVAGRNSVGRAFGALFASLWSFIQPALLYTLIFGKNFWHALFYVNTKLFPEDLLLLLFLAVVVSKALAAVFLSIFAPRMPLQFFKKISAQVSASSNTRRKTNPYLQALADLLKPSFLLSLAMVALLLYSTYVASDAMALQLLRPLAIGYLVSVVMRIVPAEKLLYWIQNLMRTKKETIFHKALQDTLKQSGANDDK